jgi:hypothetical protein
MPPRAAPDGFMMTPMTPAQNDRTLSEAGDGAAIEDWEEKHIAANINPQTGLATDYLNHFNEAVMLLDMLRDAPECLADIMQWRPKTYREHFAAVSSPSNALALDAYRRCDSALRETLDDLADRMNTILVLTVEGMRIAGSTRKEERLACCASGWLKPLIARARTLINGGADVGLGLLEPQESVDRLMTKST